MEKSLRPPALANARPGSATWLRPGILTCVSPLDQTEPSIRAYYAGIRRALDEGTGPYVMITDTLPMKTMPDAVGRRLHGQLARDLVENHRRRCARSIVIVESPAVRAVLTAVRWVFGDSGVATEVVATFDEALRSAQSKT